MFLAAFWVGWMESLQHTLCITAKPLTDMDAGCETNDKTPNVLIFQHLNTAISIVLHRSGTNAERKSTQLTNPGSPGYDCGCMNGAVIETLQRLIIVNKRISYCRGTRQTASVEILSTDA